MHLRTPMRVNICRQSVSPQAEEDNGNSPPKEEPGKVITYSNILLKHKKLNQNLNPELAPPDPGLPPSLHSPGGDSQPLTAEVILILEQAGLKFTSQSGSTFSTTSTSCEPRAVSRGHPSKSL